MGHWKPVTSKTASIPFLLPVAGGFPKETLRDRLLPKFIPENVKKNFGFVSSQRHISLLPRHRAPAVSIASLFLLAWHLLTLTTSLLWGKK